MRRTGRTELTYGLRNSSGHGRFPTAFLFFSSLSLHICVPRVCTGRANPLPEQYIIIYKLYTYSVSLNRSIFNGR